MKNLPTIQDELKQLPKYSLTHAQKQRIRIELRQKRKPSITIFKPFVTGSAILLALFLIVTSGAFQESESSVMKKQVALQAVKGERFALEKRDGYAIGTQNKAALLDTFGHFVAKDKSRVAKVMIYLWGDSKELAGKSYKVEAMNQYGEKLQLAEGELAGGLYGEDAQIITSFTPIPSAGVWQLSFYVDGNYHSAFTLNVLPPFPKTKHYVLTSSPKELKIGKNVELYMEGTKNKKEIKVQLLNEKGKVVDSEVFKGKGLSGIDAETSQKEYGYSGGLIIPDKGTWSLVIDGEKTLPFNN
ncbi:hypothetical protein ACFQPF_16410 [Fictibacillus iocasae]|uniref:DUF4871 domain-containing protein n=1 Tax=Fictibacillus iocasae TaxID=2715437 RepID=A0ABW2NRX6_9BACL